MKNIIRVMLRSISAEFFKEHAVPFLAIFYFCFGLLKPADHIALMKWLLQSQFLMPEVYIVWSLYLIRVIHFTISQMRRPSYFFMHLLYLLPLTNKVMVMVAILTGMMLPILFYAVFLFYTGLQQHAYLNVVSIPCFFVIAGGFSIICLLKSLRYTATGYKPITWGFPALKIRKPAFSYFFYHLFTEKFTITIITKVLSAFVLIGFMTIFNVGTTDLRPLLITMLVIAGIHINLVFEYFAFQNRQLLLFRQFPIPLLKKYMAVISTLICILLPELFLMARYAPMQYAIWKLLIPYLFAVCLLLPLYAKLLFVHDPEKLLNQTVIAAIILFFSIMFYGYPVVALVAITVSIRWFWKFYYQYEPLAGDG